MTSAVATRPRLRSSASVVSRVPEWLLDGMIAATALALSLLLASQHLSALRPGPGGLDAASAVLLAGTTVPLVAWRRWPRRVFIATGMCAILLGGFGYSIGLLVGPTIALFLWTASRDDAAPWTRRDSELVVVIFFAYVAASALGDHGAPAVELLHDSLAFAVAWFAGERTRLRRAHIADLEARAHRAEREIDQDRRIAVAEERARIARDLHDSVGHAINVIAVRAGAARLRHDREPERSIGALEAIEDIARQTADEIDQIVGALRDSTPDGATRTPLGLASLPTLVARHAANGIDVSVARLGNDRVPDASVDLAAYRILQEALTNAARHGSGTVDVEVVIGATAVDFTVGNPTAPPAIEPPGSGGHGLVGMRERVAMLGGTIAVEHGDDAFSVRVHLPYRERRS